MKAKLIDQLPAAAEVAPIPQDTGAFLHRPASDSGDAIAAPVTPHASQKPAVSFAETLFLWTLSRR